MGSGPAPLGHPRNDVLLRPTDPMTTARSVIGDAPKRREDLRFITGRGGYLDDLSFEGLAHAVVLRSPHAHPGFRAVGSGAARTAPRVRAGFAPRGAPDRGAHP